MPLFRRSSLSIASSAGSKYPAGVEKFMSLQTPLIAESNWSQRLPQSVDINFDRLPDFYGTPWAFKCISLVASLGAMVPLRVFNKTVERSERKVIEESGKEKIESVDEEKIERIYNHKIERLYKKVNPFQNGFDLFLNAISFHYLTGAMCFEVVFDGNGSPSELYNIDTRRLEVVPDKKNKIAGYIYRINGRTIPIPARNIIIVNSFHPSNDYWGLPTVKVARSGILIDEKAKAFRSKFFDAGTLIGGTLETDQDLTPLQYKQIRSEFKKYEGLRNAHRIAILEAGMSYKQVVQKANEMEYISGRKFSMNETCALFGVDPIIFGMGESNSKGEREAALKLIYMITVMPILYSLESKFNERFFGDSAYNNTKSQTYAQFDTSEIKALQDDIEVVSRVIARLVDRGILKINEARGKYLKLASVPWGETFWRPLNTILWNPSHEPDVQPGTDRTLDGGSATAAPNKTPPAAPKNSKEPQTSRKAMYDGLLQRKMLEIFGLPASVLEVLDNGTEDGPLT